MSNEKKTIESDVKAEGMVFVTVFFDRVAYGETYLTRRVYALSDFSMEMNRDIEKQFPYGGPAQFIPGSTEFKLTGVQDQSLGNVDLIEAAGDKQIFESVKELRNSLRVRSALQPFFQVYP